MTFDRNLKSLRRKSLKFKNEMDEILPAGLSVWLSMPKSQDTMDLRGGR